MDYKPLDRKNFSQGPHTQTPPEFLQFSCAFGTIYAIGEDHFSCLNFEAFKENVLPKIEDPKEWKFLLEGSSLYPDTPGALELFLQTVTGPMQQPLLLNAYAQERGIPVVDPVITPSNPKLIRMAPDYGVPAGDVLIYLVGKFVGGVYTHADGTPEQIERAKSFLSMMHNIPKDAIDLLCEENNNFQHYRGSPHFNETQEKLTALSNALSQRRLQYELCKNRRTNNFISLGLAHLPIVRELK